MRIIRTENYDMMSRKAAAVIAAQIVDKPDCVLGLATGSTPIGTYERLVQMYREGDIDFAGVRVVNLDEYRGLTKDNVQSYYYFMYKYLFSHINISMENTYIPDGTEPDAKKECERYDKVIAGLGGIDLQLLGLGHDGHIGFNEPADCFAGTTHCVDLTESTIEANKRFFGDASQVPKQAYTIGVGTIMSASRILLIVSGKDKAQILAKAVLGPVTPRVPASALQLHHDVILVADQAALSEMRQ